VIVPYLRGHGPTRFRDPATPRSGQQAALGTDVVALMDALELPRAVPARYDWGGRAASIVAALWPDRCAGLVSVNNYLIQDVSIAAQSIRTDLDFDDTRLDRPAQGLLNEDYVQVVIHSYRHRLGLAAGEPDPTSRCRASRSTLRRTAASPPRARTHLRVPHAGHNLPHESPAAFLDLARTDPTARPGFNRPS